MINDSTEKKRSITRLTYSWHIFKIIWGEVRFRRLSRRRRCRYRGKDRWSQLERNGLVLTHTFDTPSSHTHTRGTKRMRDNSASVMIGLRTPTYCHPWGTRTIKDSSSVTYARTPGDVKSVVSCRDFWSLTTNAPGTTCNKCFYGEWKAGNAAAWEFHTS